MSREEINNNLQWVASKTFEERYIGAANDKLDKGPKEMKKPEDDEVLNYMKQ